MYFHFIFTILVPIVLLSDIMIMIYCDMKLFVIAHSYACAHVCSVCIFCVQFMGKFWRGKFQQTIQVKAIGKEKFGK